MGEGCGVCGVGRVMVAHLQTDLAQYQADQMVEHSHST